MLSSLSLSLLYLCHQKNPTSQLSFYLLCLTVAFDKLLFNAILIILNDILEVSPHDEIFVSLMANFTSEICLNRPVTNTQVPGAHFSGCPPAAQKCPLGQMPPVESLFGFGILAPRRQ